LRDKTGRDLATIVPDSVKPFGSEPGEGIILGFLKMGLVFTGIPSFASENLMHFTGTFFLYGFLTFAVFIKGGWNQNTKLTR
jgi:hypothetical protein